VSATRTLAGVDGCRAGWIAAVERPGEGCALVLAPRFADLLRALPADAILAVDMPIGLPERIEGAGRAADRAARAALGRRGGSVFAIPARAAVEAGAGPFADRTGRMEAYRKCCALARALSEPPRAPSIQSFGLFPRINDVDRALRAAPRLGERVFESHPELAFARMAGAPVPSSKKTVAGLAERRALLLANGLPPALLDAPRPAGATEDDRIDACAMLLVARRIAAGTARPSPDPPERDAEGIAVAIWF